MREIYIHKCIYIYRYIYIYTCQHRHSYLSWIYKHFLYVRLRVLFEVVKVCYRIGETWPIDLGWQGRAFSSDGRALSRTCLGTKRWLQASMGLWLMYVDVMDPCWCSVFDQTCCSTCRNVFRVGDPFGKKKLGENQDHIQSSQVALRDFTGKQFLEVYNVWFFLGDDIALLLVLGFKLIVLTQMPFFDTSDHLRSWQFII